MNEIVGKNYLKIRFKLVSPLIIGCGKNENTDNDVLTDSVGLPYIPGTAIAGVVRDAVASKDYITEQDIEKIFGEVIINTESATESRLLFYDANLIPEDRNKYNISVRDSVALDEYKTARDGAKFDMEVLEPGVTFETFIEMNIGTDVEAAKKVWEIIKSIWKSGNITFGGKTTRGMGAIEVININKADFNFETKLDSWIRFNMYEESTQWEDVEISAEDLEKPNEIKLKLELSGGISIRQYTTDVGEEDYAQLMIKNIETGKKEIPVIPGTTWAGAFRHRVKDLLQLSGKDEKTAGQIVSLFFGDVKPGDKNGKSRSKIIFSESQITGGSSKIVTRNAIDRFTGGASDGALYTEKMYYGGNTDLIIKINKKKAEKEFGEKYKNNTEIGDWSSVYESFINALAAAVADLHGGYLAVGGLTAVGRGLFKVTEVNSEGNGIKEKRADELYVIIRNSLDKTTKEVG